MNDTLPPQTCIHVIHFRRDSSCEHSSLYVLYNLTACRSDRILLSLGAVKMVTKPNGNSHCGNNNFPVDQKNVNSTLVKTVTRDTTVTHLNNFLQSNQRK